MILEDFAVGVGAGVVVPPGQLLYSHLGQFVFFMQPLSKNGAPLADAEIPTNPPLNCPSLFFSIGVKSTRQWMSSFFFSISNSVFFRLKIKLIDILFGLYYPFFPVMGHTSFRLFAYLLYGQKSHKLSVLSVLLRQGSGDRNRHTRPIRPCGSTPSASDG